MSLRIATRPIRPIHLTTTLKRQLIRSFSATTTANMPRDTKTFLDRPKHVPVYFPKITSLSAKDIPHFRKVVHTGLFSQVVLMNIPVGGDIGEEVHLVDQALTFTQGKGLCIVGGKPGQGGKDGKGEGAGGGEIRKEYSAGDMIVVPAGTRHQFWNTGDEPMILYTIYSPAEHHPQTYHASKEQGEEEEDAGKDEAPEWAGKSKAENVKAGVINEEGQY